jgi:serine/threonine-protein kinase
LVVSSGEETVAVPRVVDQNMDSARAELRGQGFEVEVVEEPSDVVEKGIVIDQDPAAGAQAPAGSRVTITVSTGPEKVKVPNVRLLSLTEATTLIENAGLKVGAVTDRASSREPNTVLEQSPPGGSEAAKGSQVDLVVAAVPEDVTVPPVVGLTADEAKLALKTAGFTVTSEGGDPLAGEPAGTVIDQVPAANTLAPAGSNVVIIVSTGVTPTTAQPPAPQGLPPGASPQGPE